MSTRKRSAEEGNEDGPGVLRGAVPVPWERADMGLRLECHEQRMFRSLHGRWPYRRSHCRHDHHWLVRVQPRESWCASARAHSLAGLRICSRRP